MQKVLGIFHIGKLRNVTFNALVKLLTFSGRSGFLTQGMMVWRVGIIVSLLVRDCSLRGLQRIAGRLAGRVFKKSFLG